MRYAPIYHPLMTASYGWDFAMSLFWFLFLIVIIALIIRAMRHHVAESTTTQADPLDIAKNRYARGDITKDEFDQIKKDLSTK